MEVVCPHCSSVNRVPTERIGDEPVCGRCARPKWCGPCRAMAPQFAAAAKRMQGRVVLGKVDTDLEIELSQSLRIRSIPTLMLFRGGKEIARVSGAMSAADLERWVDQTLAQAA